MRLFNERSGVEFDAWFQSYPGEPTIPPSVHYRLLCVTTGKTLIDWTEVPYEILSSEEGIDGVKAHIDIAGSDNILQSRASKREVKELQVVSGKDTDREYSEVLQYGIVPMTGQRA